LNPFDYGANSVYLNAQLQSNQINPAITPNATYPAIYLSKQALNLLKAVSYSQAYSNASLVKALGWDLDIMLIR
jgi:hypothetical protein